MKPAVGSTCLILFLLLSTFCSPVAAGQKIKSLCQFQYPSDLLIDSTCVRLTSKDSPYRIFGKNWQDGLRFNRMDRRHFIAGIFIKVPKSIEDIKDFSPMPEFYPDAEQEAKFILIDQNEMFLGAYEYGKLVFSTPVAVGVEEHRLANGSYRVDAVDPRHESSLYPVEGTDRPYPMHYGLRFHIDKKAEGWTSYWLHGRDLPGYPASHGCIGLYDEEMQKTYYKEPGRPVLKDAKRLYQWVLGTRRNPDKMLNLRGPRVLVTGAPPPAAGSVPLTATAPAPAAAVTPVSGKPLPAPTNGNP